MQVSSDDIADILRFLLKVTPKNGHNNHRFSTLPFVWSLVRRGGTTLLVCFTIIIRFLSSSVLSTSAWLFTIACMVKHHIIWPTSSRNLPQRPPEQASGPPRLAVSQCHVPRHHLVTACSLWLLRLLGTIYRHHFIELNVSVNTFKCQLKTFLFAQAF